jgi:acetyltransferase-like isoleucine patch superfamily enzyme
MKKLLLAGYSAIQRIYLQCRFSGHISIGRNCHFRGGFWIRIRGGELKIGEDVFANRGLSINVHKRIEIGAHTIIGEDVKLYDHDHEFRDKGRLIRDQGFFSEAITIGENCWLCSNVVILKGTTIGRGSVIGAGAIIKGVIPEYSIVKAERGTFIAKDY